jgi:hypothetical protein
MVKQQRSSRTRHRPVRSGRLRGDKRIILPRLPTREIERQPAGNSASLRRRRPNVENPAPMPA